VNQRNEVISILDELLPSYATARKKYCIDSNDNSGVQEANDVQLAQTEVAAAQ
jgi:hypothetical protein